MPFGFHPIDLIAIAVIALLIFGPKRLPEMGASIGKSIKAFQKGMKEINTDDDDDDDDEEEAKPISSKEVKKLKSKTVETEPAPKSSVGDLSSVNATEVKTETTEVHAE